MSIPLHTATVAAWLQGLPKVAALVDRAEKHCEQTGIAPLVLTEATLAPDMWPFCKQVFECGHHSARAIKGVHQGVFRPEIDPVPSDFPSLREEISQSIALLERVDPDELERRAGDDMRFELGERVMPFTVADFLLTFSMPNFYFHATTAYAILRSQGLPIGKRDFIGQMRLKR